MPNHPTNYHKALGIEPPVTVLMDALKRHLSPAELQQVMAAQAQQARRYQRATVERHEQARQRAAQRAPITDAAAVEAKASELAKALGGKVKKRGK